MQCNVFLSDIFIIKGNNFHCTVCLPEDQGRILSCIFGKFFQILHKAPPPVPGRAEIHPFSVPITAPLHTRGILGVALDKPKAAKSVTVTELGSRVTEKSLPENQHLGCCCMCKRTRNKCGGDGGASTKFQDKCKTKVPGQHHKSLSLFTTSEI